MQPDRRLESFLVGIVHVLCQELAKRKFLKLQEFIQSVSEDVCARPAGSAAIRAGMSLQWNIRRSH